MKIIRGENEGPLKSFGTDINIFSPPLLSINNDWSLTKPYLGVVFAAFAIVLQIALCEKRINPNF